METADVCHIWLSDIEISDMELFSKIYHKQIKQDAVSHIQTIITRQQVETLNKAYDTLNTVGIRASETCVQIWIDK